MTTDDGKYALRNRNDWGGKPGVDEPLAVDDSAACSAEEDAQCFDGNERTEITSQSTSHNS